MLLTVYRLRDMAHKGFIEVISSLTWSSCMQEPGEMALEVPYSPEVDALLMTDNCIMIPGSPEAMMILDKSMQRDGNGIALLQVKGRTLLQLLDRRCLPADVSGTWTPGAYIQKLLNDNIISPADSWRALANVTATANPDITEAQECQAAAGDVLLDTVQTAVEEAGFGIRVLTDPAIPQHTIDVYSAADRSVGQPAQLIFCPDNGTAHVTGYTESVDNYANLIRIYGKQKGSSTTGTAIGYEGSAPPSGYALVERYLSTDVDSVATAALQAQAVQELQNYQREYTVEIEIHPNARYVLGTDYDVGCVVTVRDPEFGIDMNATITEITQTWNAGQADKIKVKLGFGTPRLERRIRTAIRAGR